MGSVLKGMVLGIGIFFGILQPDRTPVLGGRLYRTDDLVFASIEVDNGLSPDAESLVLAGNTLRLTVTVSLNGKKAAEPVHSLTYDLKGGVFILDLGDGSGVHRTRSADAAKMLFLEFPDIPVADIGRLDGHDGCTVTARASLEIPDDDRFDAMMLWNYIHPINTWQFDRLTEIPR